MSTRNNSARLALGVAGGLALAGCSSQVAARQPERPPHHEEPATASLAAHRALAQRLDRVLDGAIAEQRIVGAVVLVARGGTLVYHRPVGLLDREARLPMTERAVFRLASLTKPIVALAVLALVEQGKLSLDDAISRWLPQLQFRDASGRPERISIRQLLTHTSGLGYGFLEPPDGPYHRAQVSDGLDQPGLSFEENARRLTSVPLGFPPGTGFRYSLGYDVLGEVAACAARQPLASLVRELVTGPLGMHDTAFEVADVERLAVPYADAGPAARRMRDPEHVPFEASEIRFAPSRVLHPASYASGGAGMVGTAGDFLALLELLRINDGKLVGRDAVQSMLSNQVDTLAAPFLGEGQGFGFGVAVVLDRERAGLPLSSGAFHWGGVYGHNFWVDPHAQLSVVVLTNTAVEGMSGALVTGVREAVYDAFR